MQTQRRSLSAGRQPAHAQSGGVTEKKRRSACDECHKAKIKCSGGTECERCARDNLTCHYSFRAHAGKPKGCLNKKTIEKLRAMAQKAPVTLDWSRNAACGNAPGAPQPVRPVVGDHKISSDQQEHQEQQEQPEQILQQIPQPPPPAMCHDLGLPMDDVSLEEFSNTYYRISDSIDVDMLVAQTPQYAHSYLDNHTSESDDGTSSSAEVQTRIHDSLVIEQDPRGSPIPCSCVRSLTSQVQYLHMWSRHCSTAGLDRMLQCTQQTTSCVMGFLKCPVCAFDVQPFFLVIMVLSLTLDLILPLIDPTRVGPRPMVQIRFGDFDVSAGLGKMLEKVAVRSYLGSLKAVVDRLDSKVDFVASDPAHVEFLRYEARRLKRGFYTIADQIEVSETE